MPRARGTSPSAAGPGEREPLRELRELASAAEVRRPLKMMRTPLPDQPIAFAASHFMKGKSDNDTQTSLRLPGAMYETLAKAAAEHQAGIGEEIRTRLEDSFALGACEPEMRQLTLAILQAGRHVERTYGPWLRDPFAFSVFNVAVNTLLTYFRPKGEPVPPPPDPDGLADTFFGPNASPETAGGAVAMAALAAEGIL
jgi:hypothetical protein